MVDKQKILEVMQEKGPILPKDLMKDLGANTILIGAALSELAAQKKIRISHMKVGGSPIYYLDEHKDKLQDFSDHLNEKDQRTYELLKERRILSDTEQTPLVRVSLRNIKDFARPMEAITKNRKKIFWKWYMLSPEDTEDKIRDVLLPETNTINQPTPPTFAKTPPQEIKKPKLETKKQPIVQKQPIAPAKIIKKKALPKPKTQKLTIQKKLTKKGHPKIEKQPKHEPKLSDKKVRRFSKETKKSEGLLSPETPVADKASVEEIPLELVEPDDTLHKKTKLFFKTKNILIKEINIIRKNKEIDYIVQVPSPVGQIDYYCKVKEKKRANDGDLASAYIQAQAKKLPILYIMTGDLTKKAKSMLEKEFQHVKLANLG